MQLSRKLPGGANNNNSNISNNSSIICVQMQDIKMSDRS